VKPKGQLVLKAGDSFGKHLEGTYPDEFKGLSLGRLLRGYITGNWLDAQLEMKAMGSTPSSSGGLLIPTPLSGVVIDLARAATRVMQAGAVIIPMESATLRFARLTQDVAANWTLEQANITASGAVFDGVTFTAHKLAALVAISNELLEDAANSDPVIEQSIAKSLALALDAAGLYGTGVAPVPLGLHGNVPAVAAGGTLTNYDVMLKAIADVRGANFEPNAVIYAPRTADSLARLKSGVSVTDMRQLTPPVEWANLAKLITSQVPINLGAGTNESQAFIGQWDQLGLGLRSTLQIEVSREAAYWDGTAVQAGFSRDQTVIRAVLRADYQLLHSTAFAEVTGILP
jgi:HK97 family phage major capsid protein